MHWKGGVDSTHSPFKGFWFTCSRIVSLDVHFLDINCACTFIYIYMRIGDTSIHNGCVTYCLFVCVSLKNVYINTPLNTFGFGLSYTMFDIVQHSVDVQSPTAPFGLSSKNRTRVKHIFRKNICFWCRTCCWDVVLGNRILLYRVALNPLRQEE